jgi:hypothetical protein
MKPVFVDRVSKAFAGKPQPDVAPARANGRTKTRLADTSARMSHTMFAGLVAVAFMPSSRPPPQWHANPLPKPVAAAASTLAPTQVANGDRAPAAGKSSIPPAQAEAKSQPLPSSRLPASEQRQEIHATDLTATSRTNLRKLVVRQVSLPRARPLSTVSPILPVIAASEDGPQSFARELPPLLTIKAKEHGKARDIRRPVASLAPEPEAGGEGESANNREAPHALGVVRSSAPYTVVGTWSERDIAEARAACVKLLKPLDMEMTEEPPIKEGACGTPAPVRLHRFGSPKVEVDPAVVLNCPMAAALDTWIKDKVQPAARETFGVPVVRLISASSYACRNRYDRASAPLSEHALVNAIDLSGFVLSDGRTVRVLDSWGPVARDSHSGPVTASVSAHEPPVKAGLSMLGGRVLHPGQPSKTASSEANAAVPAKTSNDGRDSKPAKDETANGEPAKDEAASKRIAFLHRIHSGACEIFGTVLGPEANDEHRNHFHLDMKARNHGAFCQ